MSDTTAPVLPNGDVFSAIKAMLSGLIGKANEIATDVQNSRVNVGKVVHEIRKDETTEDETVKAYQVWEAKALASMEAKRKAIDEYIKTNLVKTSAMSDEVFEAKKTEYSEAKKTVNNTRKMAALLPGYSDEIFADLPALQTLSGGTSSNATGSGPKRPRLASLTIDGKDVFVTKKDDDGNDVKSYTFTAAANYLSGISGHKVAPTDLSAAAFAAAGSDDLSTVNDVEFNYSVEGTDYAFVVIPVQK